MQPLDALKNEQGLISMGFALDAFIKSLCYDSGIVFM